MPPHLQAHFAARRSADTRAVTLLWTPTESGRLQRPDGLPPQWVNIDCSGDGLARLSHLHQPHVIVVELSAEPVFSNLRTVVSRYNAAIIFAAPQLTTELAMWVLRERAWDVLAMPLSAADMQASVLRFMSASRRAEGWVVRASGRVAVLPVAEAKKIHPATLPAINYVEQHYKHRLSAEKAATLCGMNSSYFSRAFKKEHGIGFSEFVLNHRLAVAKKLLANAALNVTDTAFAAGFSDHSYFSKVFKRFMGVSPSEFQAALVARG